MVTPREREAKLELTTIKDSYVLGESVYILARLYYLDGVNEVGVSGRNIFLFVILPGESDYQEIDQGATGADGSSGFSFKPQTVGEYSFRSDFPGDE